MDKNAKGFGVAGTGFSQKTLWDWLQLLIVPGSDGFWGHQSHDFTCAFR